jgi:ABC-type bacteriocin/lantibiotic exporter with double-glycine peptidase domain
VDELRREVKTSPNGTSLYALAQAARRRGFSAGGLKLTREALAKETLPAIALLPNHYVIIEAMDRDGVTYRDGEKRLQMDWKQWERMWSGILLRIAPREPATASTKGKVVAAGS